jgi:hypothetical protein
MSREVPLLVHWEGGIWLLGILIGYKLWDLGNYGTNAKTHLLVILY